MDLHEVVVTYKDTGHANDKRNKVVPGDLVSISSPTCMFFHRQDIQIWWLTFVRCDRHISLALSRVWILQEPCLASRADWALHEGPRIRFNVTWPRPTSWTIATCHLTWKQIGLKCTCYITLPQRPTIHCAFNLTPDIQVRCSSVACWEPKRFWKRWLMALVVLPAEFISLTWLATGTLAAKHGTLLHSSEDLLWILWCSIQM